MAGIGWAIRWVVAPLETKLKSRDDKKGRLFAESNVFRRKIFVGSLKTPIFVSQIKYIIKRKSIMAFLTDEKLVIVGAAGMIGSNMVQSALMMNLTSNI